MTFSLADTLYDKITEGDAFVLSELFTVAGGGTANIHLENPTDSGKKLWVTNVSASGTGEYESNIQI